MASMESFVKPCISLLRHTYQSEEVFNFGEDLYIFLTQHSLSSQPVDFASRFSLEKNMLMVLAQ